MESSFYFYPISLGLILVQGEDRKQYLQRQTTNDVERLNHEAALPSVLTSPVGKTLDVFLLYEDSPQAIAAVSLTGSGAETTRFFKSHIFFMDKVAIEDASSRYAFAAIWGEAAAGAARTLGFEGLPGDGKILSLPMDSGKLKLAALNIPFGLGYLLISPADAFGGADAALEEAGGIRVDSKIYEVWRVESGIPAPRHELTGDYTPLEVNLERAVSGEKGCYTGQEILARQITYDKVVRKLVGLRLEAPVIQGSPVYVGGAAAGEVTSAASSPDFGEIALAVIRRPHFEAGTQVTVKSGDQEVAGVLTSLPFRQPVPLEKDRAG